MFVIILDTPYLAVLAGGHEHVVPGAAVLATEHLVAVLVHDVGDRGQEAAQDPPLSPQPRPSVQAGLAHQVHHVSTQQVIMSNQTGIIRGTEKPAQAYN